MTRAMKDSGVEWIGEIPKEWESVRLKDGYSFEKGKNAALYTKEYIGTNQGEYPVYSGQTENDGVMGKVDTFDYEIDECLFTTTVGAKVMSPKILKGKFNLSQNCLIMKSNGLMNNHFVYYILFPLFDYQKAGIPSYMQPSLRVSDLKKYHFYIPSLKEQQKIADFLDEKTAHIDSIITQTKESIEAFKAYKQTLITETVTKGLNPDVKMKDSGIEWIGEIPKHWDAWKLKQLFEIKKVIAGKLGYDILSITQNGLKIKDISSNEGQISADYSKYQIVDIGDFAMNHMDLLTGWVDCATFSGVTSPDYRVFKSRNLQVADNNYYKYIFQVCYSNKIFYGLGQGASNLGRWRLPTSNFLNFVIPHSPIDEQQQIADFLDEKTAHIDSLIADKQKMVQELQEYKKSLIYEYVTGKKEV